MANTRLKTRIEELERRQPAARACVSTQFDKDALELYPIQFELHGKTYPDHTVFEQTSIAIRGRELVHQICGPIIPVHKDPKWNQRTSASREFKCCFEREPVEGDLLRCEHIRVMRGAEMNEIKFSPQIEAWRRQLPHLPCPLKFEDGRLFRRQRNGEWVEAVEVSWRAHWWGVECDAQGAPEAWAYGQYPEFWSEPDPDPLGRMPSIRAVTFLGLIDGKWHAGPQPMKNSGVQRRMSFFGKFSAASRRSPRLQAIAGFAISGTVFTEACQWRTLPQPQEVRILITLCTIGRPGNVR
jgi:hypothetical protein